MIFPHVHHRVAQYLSATDIGYQAGLALKAFAHGGLAGVGPGAGTIKYRIPDAHSDYHLRGGGRGIRPGALRPSSPLLFCLLTVRLLLRAADARDPFCQLAGAGLAVVTAVQAFINMGVAVVAAAGQGHDLPFISYGGSSLFAVALTMGFALAVTRQRPKIGARARDVPASLLGGAAHERPIVLSAGGTGGHLFPAQALAGELARRGREHRGDDRCPLRQLRHPVSRRADRDRAVLAAQCHRSRPSRSRPASCWRCAKLLRLKPAAVIGFGGYPWCR